MAKTYHRGTSDAELERRIIARSEANPNDHSLDQAIDLADLHARDRSRFQGLIQRGHVKHRRAYYLRKVGALLLEGSIRRSQAEVVGWTKLQIIADGLTRSNTVARLRLARELPVYRLKEALANADQSAERRCVLMYFTPEQYDEFSEALIEAGADEIGRGLSGKEEWLISILREWKQATSGGAESVS